jgi:hypothetical protein
MEVCILDGTKIERHGLTTKEKGRHILVRFLRKSDVVGYEVSSLREPAGEDIGTAERAINFRKVSGGGNVRY